MIPPINPPDHSSPQTYGFSRKMKLAFSIGVPIGIAVFGWMAVYFFVDTSVGHDLWLKLLIAAISLGMIVVFVLGLLEVWRCSMTIHPDRLHFVEIIGEREFLLSEIEGYRVKPQGQGVYLVLKNRPRKKIGIPSNLEKFPEIIQRLDAHLKNLDAIEFKAEEEKILENADLGATPDERKEKLDRVRQLLKQSRWVAIAVVFWNLVYPRPYELSIAVAGLLPIAGIVLVLRSHGLVHVDDDKRGAHPSAAVLMIPGAALAFRAFADYNIVDYNDIWVPAGTLLALIALVLIWSSEEYRTHPLQFLPALFFLAFYSYGLTVEINCLLDQSEPQTHPVRVLNKRASKDKHRLLYFTVSPWGEKASDNEIQVSPSVYNTVRVGDTVHVREKAGLVGVRWFYTRQQHDASSP